MQPDGELAARDRWLRGLDVLLDDERLTAALHEALPGMWLSAARATYVRYKPGTACIVMCRLTLADEQVDAYVRLERESSRDKLSKHARKAKARSRLGRGAVLLPRLPAALYPYPNDAHVAALAHLADDGRRRSVLEAALPDSAALWSSSLQPLRWKPERRFVAALEGDGGKRAVVKAYAGTPAAALRAATALGGRPSPRMPRRIGHSAASRIVVLEWLAGRPLEGELLPGGAAMAGEALAQLHAIPPLLLPLCTRDAELRRVLQSVETVGWLVPDARGAALRIAQQIARRLPRDVLPVIAHGDFSADQVLVHEDRAALVDLDEAVLSDPLRDLGRFLATLGREVVAGRVTAPEAAAAQAQLLAGYGRVDRAALRAWTATALLHLAPEPFRQREPDWPARILELLAMAESLLDG
jgi:hypothetical protein